MNKLNNELQSDYVKTAHVKLSSEVYKELEDYAYQYDLRLSSAIKVIITATMLNRKNPMSTQIEPLNFNLDFQLGRKPSKKK